MVPPVMENNTTGKMNGVGGLQFQIRWSEKALMKKCHMSKDLTEVMSKQVRQINGGKESKAEATVSAKVLGCEYAWCVQGTTRPV